MTPEVEQICEKLSKLSNVNLHLVYIRVLARNLIPPPPMVIPYHCCEDKVKALSFYLAQDSYQAQTLFNEVKFMLDDFSSSKIPEQNFEWIDPKNHRQCIFFWLLIQSILTQGIFLKMDRWGNVISVYSDLGLPPTPSSAKTCLELARDFFYLWDIDQTTKINFIYNAKLEWEKASKFKHRTLKKLEKDIPELTAWFDENSTKYLPFNLYKIEIKTFAEKLPLVLAEIDSWLVPQSEKTVSLDKAYTAMAGKKYKQKPSDQKGANFWLGAEQIRMISQIAQKKKMSERDTLLSLISDAYIKTET
jgi:hypothetical protein